MDSGLRPPLEGGRLFHDNVPERANAAAEGGVGLVGSEEMLGDPSCFVAGDRAV